MQYTIDATNKSLGRVASEVAALLIGKNTTAYTPNNVVGNIVIVENASKLSVDPKKLSEKIYTTYSGYPGGLKEATMAHVISKKGYEAVVKNAVKGMLPDNKLKKEMLKNLTVKE